MGPEMEDALEELFLATTESIYALAIYRRSRGTSGEEGYRIQYEEAVLKLGKVTRKVGEMHMAERAAESISPLATVAP